MALPTAYLLTPDRVDAERVGAATRWLAPPFAALVFLVHPVLSLLRPARQLWDPGIGWHLATGRYILATGSIPHQDVFSFTAADHPWIQYYWLFDTAAALLERLGGLPLYATVCMLIYAAVPLLLYRRMMRMGAAILPALLLSALAQIVLMSHALARPHVVTYLLFAFFLGRLDDVDTGRRTPASLWILPPLAALWCNLHAGFLAGVALAGIFTVVAVARALATRDPAARRAAWTFGILLAALLLATAANPNGFELHRDAIHHLGMRTTGAFAEFASPDFQAPTRPVLCFELLVLATLATAVVAGRRIAWVELALLVFFLHQALHAVRHINLFAIVAAPIVARELSVLLTEQFPAWAARWRAIALEQAALRSERLYVPAIAVGVLALALGGASGFPTTLDDQQLSRGAAAYIAAHPDRITRPFNTDNVGGALIYRFGPALRVFFDDRIYVYGDDFVADQYLPVHGARRGWADILAHWDVDSAVVAAGAPCATALRTAADWQLAYEDDQTLIFLRDRQRMALSTAPHRAD